MNEHEIERIADCMNRLRPDWPTKQLRTLLGSSEMASRPRRDVTVALAWVACESGTSSPYRVLESGPWWKAAGVEGTLTRRHLTADQSCRHCGREYGPDCCDFPGRERIERDPEATHRIVESLKSTVEPTRPPSEPRPTVHTTNGDAARAALHPTTLEAQ